MLHLKRERERGRKVRWERAGERERGGERVEWGRRVKGGEREVMTVGGVSVGCGCKSVVFRSRCPAVL
jgi:hypothetical protein